MTLWNFLRRLAAAYPTRPQAPSGGATVPVGDGRSGGCAGMAGGGEVRPGTALPLVPTRTRPGSMALVMRRLLAADLERPRDRPPARAAARIGVSPVFLELQRHGVVSIDAPAWGDCPPRCRS